MNIVILSRNRNLYSTKRLVEEAEDRGHFVEVIDPLNCDLIIEKEKPTIYYRDKYLDYVDAIIPRIGASVTFYGCAVVRQFEMMNIFSTVSSDSIIRSRDKLRSFQHLSKGGIDMPKTVFTNYSRDVNEVIDKRKKINLILNLGNFKNYLKNKPYLGSTCGRFANRIKNGQFKIDSKTYQLSKNEGRNILHGGCQGFDSKIWKIKRQNSNSITYEYLSPHLEEGFPGNLKVQCKYQIHKNSFKIIFSAQSDQKSHVNLVNHAYWNLNKSKTTIFDHFLLINANSYLKNDSSNIPTGEYKKVNKTPYDFRQFRHIGQQIELNRRAFDENFVLNKKQKFAACFGLLLVAFYCQLKQINLVFNFIAVNT